MGKLKSRKAKKLRAKKQRLYQKNLKKFKKNPEKYNQKLMEKKAKGEKIKQPLSFKQEYESVARKLGKEFIKLRGNIRKGVEAWWNKNRQDTPQEAMDWLQSQYKKWIAGTKEAPYIAKYAQKYLNKYMDYKLDQRRISYPGVEVIYAVDSSGEFTALRDINVSLGFRSADPLAGYLGKMTTAEFDYIMQPITDKIKDSEEAYFIWEQIADLRKRYTVKGEEIDLREDQARFDTSYEKKRRMEVEKLLKEKRDQRMVYTGLLAPVYDKTIKEVRADYEKEKQYYREARKSMREGKKFR